MVLANSELSVSSLLLLESYISMTYVILIMTYVMAKDRWLIGEGFNLLSPLEVRDVKPDIRPFSKWLKK
jgi:hypothetical protein